MILVEADTSEEWDSRIDWQELAEKAVRAAVASSEHAALGTGPARIEVSVKLTDDAEVRALNAAWRGKDKATNVLSFPMIDTGTLAMLAKATGGEALLGDIVLAHGVCVAEASDKGIAAEDHAAHLIVHGALHLLGHDHEHGEAEAEHMEAIERAALAAIGIPDPYPATEVQS